MPTIETIGPYRFYFVSHDGLEPAHVHIDRDDSSAKFWLDSVNLARNIRFSAKELRKIEKIVIKNQTKFLEAWNGYFGIGSG